VFGSRRPRSIGRRGFHAGRWVGSKLTLGIWDRIVNVAIVLLGLITLVSLLQCWIQTYDLVITNYGNCKCCGSVNIYLPGLLSFQSLHILQCFYFSLGSKVQKSKLSFC
jgi:hypothetical protein